ncbi:MAG TPA: anaerobic glycerol-3-phosphate dehydrogenase subunit GlpB [Candidatus Limnocylindrales bacterium]|nr:anaerobic glycerol-3-phosphate dehydrogenase subunit GlpB [Candidatus Limnocylindrales bacterium]
MARADVVVVGAGLAGLSAAVGLAEAGARVEVLATGHAATHWAPGGLDVAAVPGTETPAAGLRLLAARPQHPYALLASHVAPALAWLRGVVAGSGLVYVGDLDAPIRPVPTSVGRTRPAAILPEGQAAALAPWAPDERLLICGPLGFKDFWPEAVAAGLRRPEAWPGTAGPARVDAVTFEPPGFRGTRNHNALDLARAFDDASWREAALVAIARAVSAAGPGPGRVALPACLGLADHPAVLEAARATLPLEPFEVPLVPPSLPGLRLYRALREALRRAGGRLQIGEAVQRVDVEAGRVVRVAVPAAARQHLVATGALVLATGGIAGGGLLATMDGRLEETVLGLPVEAPDADAWLAQDPLDPQGHPLEAAGVRTDGQLRPVDPTGASGGAALYENVHVVGSLLAGQRYLRERCGDGVALASGHLAAELLGSGRATGRQSLAEARR